MSGLEPCCEESPCLEITKGRRPNSRFDQHGALEHSGPTRHKTEFPFFAYSFVQNMRIRPRFMYLAREIFGQLALTEGVCNFGKCRAQNKKVIADLVSADSPKALASICQHPPQIPTSHL